MSMITATAVITARDQASGVFAQVARAAAQASGRYQSFAGSMAGVGAKMQSVQALSMAMPSALSVGSLGHNAYEWDRAIHQYKAIAEVPEETFQALSSKITEVSNNLGVNKMELLDAARGWVEIGGKAEAVIPVLERVTESAKIMGLGIKETMQESRGLMMAFGMDADKAENILDMENFFLVASKMVRGGGHALVEGMKNAAPIAGMMAHINKEQTAAMLSTIIDAGFGAGESGNALKTSLMRLYAPSKDVVAEMRASGIQREKLFHTDPNKVRDTKSFEDRLQGSGIEVTKDAKNLIGNVLGKYDGSQSFNQVSDALMKNLASALHMKKGDVQNRKLLQKIVDQHMAATFNDLNIDEFFKLRDKSKAALIKMFGKDHGAKVYELLNNEKKYRERLEKLNQDKDGAIQRKSAVFFEGFAHEWNKVTTSFDNLLNSVGMSGIKGDAAAVFQSVSAMFRELQSTDPNVLRIAFGGIAALAVLPPLGLALAGISTALAFFASPGFLVAVAALGGLKLSTDLVVKAAQDWDKLKESADGALKALISAKTWLSIDGDGSSKLDAMGNSTGAGPDIMPNKEYSTYDDDAKPPDVYGPVRPGDDLRWLAKKRAPPSYQPLFDYFQERAGTGLWAPEKSQVGPDGLKPLSLLDLSVMRDVKVTGDVAGTMKLEATIKVDGQGTVTDQRSSGGEIKGSLNTGRSMPDTGSGSGHYDP